MRSRYYTTKVPFRLPTKEPMCIMALKQTSAAIENDFRTTPSAGLSRVLIRARTGTVPGGATVLSKETAPKSGPDIGEESPSKRQDGKATPSTSPTSSPSLSSTVGEQPNAVKPQGR